MHEIKTWLCFTLTTTGIIVGWLSVGHGIVNFIQSLAIWIGIVNSTMFDNQTYTDIGKKILVLWTFMQAVSGYLLVISVKMVKIISFVSADSC